MARARLFTALIALGLCLGCPVPAYSLQLSPEQQRGVAQTTYQGGASRQIPGIGCNPVCEDLARAERRPLPNTSTARGLLQDSRAFRVGTRVLPKLLGRVSLVGATGSFGYTIGTELRKKWIGGPTPPSGTTAGMEVSQAELVLEGQPLGGMGPYDLYAPEDGFRGLDSNGFAVAKPINDHHPGLLPECVPSHEDSLLVEGWGTPLKTPTVTSQSYCGPWISHFEALFSPLITTRSDGEGLGALEPWTGQPTTGPAIDWWGDQPSTEGELDERVNTATSQLESTRPRLAQKIEFELGTEGVCDPIEPAVCNTPDSIRTEQQKRCDLGDGGRGSDPDPGRSIKQNDPALYVTHQAFVRRAEGSDPGEPLVPTALKKGWTTPHSSKEWGGWGWRHVAAKHGWTADDVLATAEALTFPPQRVPTKPNRLIYAGPVYSRNGEQCQRTVVVQTEPRGENEPEAPEIMTSFGKLLQ